MGRQQPVTRQQHARVGGTPAAVIDKLNTALNKVVAMPEVLARFKADAVDAMPGTPVAQAKFIDADYQAWRDVVRTQKLRIE